MGMWMILLLPSCTDALLLFKSTMLDAWGWCTGTTQRDGMGREEGGGFRMGNACIPALLSALNEWVNGI